VSDHGDVNVRSEFGDMQVVVFMPGEHHQAGYQFRPRSLPDGLNGVSRRDLMIIRAMLQDALDDVDEERNRRVREAYTEQYPNMVPPPGVGRPV
jgi:hypothetical protein